MLPNSPEAKFRMMRLGMAVATSLVSKAGSIVLQLLAIPVAVRVLGFQMYGVYASLTTAWAFLSVTGIGVGPGLTKAIAKAHATGNEEAEQSYFTTALLLLSGAGLLAGGLVFSVLTYFPAARLFGTQFAQYQGIVTQCAPIMGVLIFTETILSVVERTQAGYQEMHRSNLWGAAGNMAGGLVLLLGIRHFPSVPFLIIATLGIQSCCRLANMVVMMGWHRRYLLARSLRFDRVKARELLGDGMAFTSAQALAPLLMREGSKLLASHMGGPAAAGIYAVLNQLSTFIGSAIAMFSTPMWPALMDAAARQDHAWFDSARRRLQWGIMTYTFVAVAGLMVFGPWLISHWLGGQVTIARDVLVAFAFFYICVAWEHVNYICLTALGVLNSPAVITLTEAVGSLFIGAVGMRYLGMAGLLWGGAISMALLSAWLLPLILSQRLRSRKYPHENLHSAFPDPHLLPQPASTSE